MPLASFQQGRPSEAMVHAGQTPSTPSAGDRSTSVVLPGWTDDCDGPAEWPGTAGAARFAAIGHAGEHASFSRLIA